MSTPLAKLRVAKLERCPGCGAEWLDIEGGQSNWPVKPLTLLLLALQRLFERPAEMPVRVSFEFIDTQRTAPYAAQ